MENTISSNSNGSGYGYNDRGIKDLVLQLGYHQNTNDTIAATNRAEISIEKSISDFRSENALGNAEGRVENAIASGVTQVASAVAAGDVRAANERAFGEVRHGLAAGFGSTNVAIEKTAAATTLSVEKVAAASALLQKDTLLAIFQDGCKTREKASDHFAALQLQACEDKHSLSAQIAAQIAEIKAICCCIKEESAKALERELAQANFKLLLASNGNGNGNSRP